MWLTHNLFRSGHPSFFSLEFMRGKNATAWGFWKGSRQKSKSDNPERTCVTRLPTFRISWYQKSMMFLQILCCVAQKPKSTVFFIWTGYLWVAPLIENWLSSIAMQQENLYHSHHFYRVGRNTCWRAGETCRTCSRRVSSVSCFERNLEVVKGAFCDRLAVVNRQDCLRPVSQKAVVAWCNFGEIRHRRK